uniref:Transmembrane protein n=1 Tax=Tanacetum cinerariifolium TaxID=118510 RepID=A0A6L2MPS9_TANCI|nr:hypothetical protein [Tanacetum cinerariifolium]
MNIKFRGGLLGLKDFLSAVEVTAAGYGFYWWSGYDHNIPRFEFEGSKMLVSDVGKLWNEYYMLELSMVRCLSLVCTFPTEGMRSIISMGSISLEGLLPSILLLVEIIVAVVIVAVILVVVVIDAITEVVIIVVIIGVEVVVTIIGVVFVVGVSFMIKLSLMIIDLSPETVLLYQKLLKFNPVDLTDDEDPSDEDGGTGMGDSTGVSVSLGEISLEGNKSWDSTLVIVIILEMKAK